ncbi:HTH-type transcriptional regulator BetI [Streptomyces sp. enrichment culture]|uniref:TetR/AcrR family transcriptional regulator n=1 Tax=Streptomyces sp. enrichment culture TaxID=1795815 RepID=UPI003F575DC3
MDKREEIVTAAVEVFGRYGFRQTSMDLVAQAAGVSRPALYQYFRNKQDVFAAVAEQVTGRLVAAAHGARDAEGTLADRVYGVLAVRLDATAGLAEPRYRQELMEQAQAMGLSPVDEKLVHVLAQLLADTAEPLETASALLAAAAGIDGSGGGPDTVHRRLRRLVDLVVAGLGTER